MRHARFVRMVLITCIVCFGLLLLAYVGLNGWIQWDAHQKAVQVWKDYPQARNRTEALILRMQSTSCTMRQRNQAVWVLGRLADRAALSSLKNEYTGKLCKHDTTLCQYELEKAIRNCGGTPEKRAKTASL